MPGLLRNLSAQQELRHLLLGLGLLRAVAARAAAAAVVVVLAVAQLLLVLVLAQLGTALVQGAAQQRR